MSSPWSHLPNSHHIDWVIDSVKENPKLWQVAAGSAREVVWGVAWSKAWDVAQSKARNVVRDKVWEKAWDRLWGSAAKSAVLALVAYDDCDQYINMDYEKLQVYATLSEKPQAVLLLPMVSVREKVSETGKYNLL